MSCCCNNANAAGACCNLSNGTCSSTTQANCTQTHAGANTQCNLCATGAFFRTCTVTVTTNFGSVVASCSDPSPAVLQYECGKTRNANGNVTGISCNQLSVGLSGSTCVNNSTEGDKVGCAYRDKNGNVITVPTVSRYFWNLSVAVSRSDGITGCGGGQTEAILTRWLLTVANNTVQATKQFQSDREATVDGASCGFPSGFTPNFQWLDLRYEKCWPCGVATGFDNRFSCGQAYFIAPDAYWQDLRTVDCCTNPLTSSVSVACAP